MKGFYHIWVWRPSLSCDPDVAYKLSYKSRLLTNFGFDWEKMFEIVDGRTGARVWVYYKLTYEPSAQVS